MKQNRSWKLEGRWGDGMAGPGWRQGNGGEGVRSHVLKGRGQVRKKQVYVSVGGSEAQMSLGQELGKKLSAQDGTWESTALLVATLLVASLTFIPLRLSITTQAAQGGNEPSPR